MITSLLFLVVLCCFSATETRGESVIVVRSLQGQGNLQEICAISGGTLTDDGSTCSVCVNEENCSCELNPANFGLTCTSFCTTIVYQNLQQEFCGSASCAVEGVASTCSGSIPFSEQDTLSFNFTCAASGTCSSCWSTWNDAACSSCTGPLDGYDCSNVEGGPIKVSDSDEGDEETTPSTELERTYQTNESFLSQVAAMTLAEASELAGPVWIGAAINDDGAMLDLYVPNDYNMIVLENLMKWNKLLSDPEDYTSYDFSKADAIVDKAISLGAKVIRGHTFLWGRIPGTTYPDSVVTQVEQSTDPNTTLREIMRQHIRSVAQHFEGRVSVWDVVNEHLDSKTDDNIFYVTFGDDYVKMAFQMADEFLEDNVRLVWNEAVGEFGLNNTKIVAWLDLLKRYKDENVRIDGIGIQGHSIYQTHNITELKAFLKEVVDLGYEVEITELDAPISLFQRDGDSGEDPFQAQGNFFGEYVQACLDTNQCAGITFWGINDLFTWFDFVFPANAPNLPLLIDDMGYRKPAWLSVRQAFVAHGEQTMDTSTSVSASLGRLVAVIALLSFVLATI